MYVCICTHVHDTDCAALVQRLCVANARGCESVLYGRLDRKEAMIRYKQITIYTSTYRIVNVLLEISHTLLHLVLEPVLGILVGILEWGSGSGSAQIKFA